MEENYENSNQQEASDQQENATESERPRRRSTTTSRRGATQSRRREGNEAYKPTGARQYRTSPARTRGAKANTSQVPGFLTAAAPLVELGLIAVVALLLLISLIGGIVAAVTPSPEEIAARQLAEDQARTPTERVDAAPSITDSNGIVHGITYSGTRFSIHGAGEAGISENKVSFAAVGDQIASDYSLELADSYAGEWGDGKYDFKPFYQEVKTFLQKSDLRYINQETPICGDEKGFSVSGWPTFVSPAACAEAIADTGFNLVNFTTNHSYDAGLEGIKASQKIWREYPELIIGGSFTSQEDRETVQLIERNGIRFAFLAYSYGDNAYENPAREPNSYSAVYFDESTAAADIERAQQVADVVIVSMHWGDEYSTEINESQNKQAQWLADRGVDLVIGTHAHSIQPVEYYTGAGGKRTPVVFGLGDFVSGWTITDTILSGIFTCDFTKDAEGAVSISNLVWHPTIEWSDGEGQTYVRMLENMTQDEANANSRTEDWPGESYQHIYELTNQVITQIPVVWKTGSSTTNSASSSSSSTAEASSSSSAATDDDAVTDDNTDYDDITYDYTDYSADDYVSYDDSGYDEDVYYDDTEDYDAGYDQDEEEY